MQLHMLVLMIALSAGCKFRAESSGGLATGATPTIQTATLFLPNNGSGYLNPPILIEEDVTYKINVVHEDKTPGRVFMSTNINLRTVKPQSLINYTPPPNSTLVSINDGPAQPANYERDNFFSIVHGGFYDRSQAMEITISDIPAVMTGGSLMAIVDTWPYEQNPEKDDAFTADASQPFSFVADLQKFTRIQSPNVRNRERIVYSLTINNLKEGFAVATDTAANQGGNPNSPLPNPLADMRVSYIDNDNPPIDITSLLEFPGDSTTFGLQSSRAVLKIDLIYTAAANDRKMIKIDLPGGKEGVIAGTADVRHFDGSGRAVEVSGPLHLYPTPPLQSPGTNTALEINHISPFTQQIAGVISQLSNDETIVAANIGADYHTPIVPGLELPINRTRQSFNSYATFNGRPVSQSGDESFRHIFAPLANGPYQFRFENPNILPRSSVLISGIMYRKDAVIRDLVPGDIDSFPSAPSATDITFNPRDYLLDAGSVEEYLTFPGATTPVNYNSELPIDYKFVVNDTPGQPRFPAREILEAMEEIRNHWHEKIPRSEHGKRTAANWVDDLAVSSCLGNTEEHWSDLTLHYYCQFGEARSCYTEKIREVVDPIMEELIATPVDQLPTTLPGALQRMAKVRADSFNFCKSKAIEARRSGVAIGPTSAEAEWLWIIENPQREKMFRFIMESPTFSFPYEIQQRIINTFYRVETNGKIANGQTPSTSINSTECTNKRPTRNIERINYKGDGTQCRSDKVLAVGQRAFRR